MNNYCTNCGNRLKEDSNVCPLCGCPIVDVQKKVNIKTVLKILLLLIILSLIIIGFLFIRNYFKNKAKQEKEVFVKKLEIQYVVPYIEKKYPYVNYRITFNKEINCAISGDCFANEQFIEDCNGNSCTPYEYDDNCKSYLFYVEKLTEDGKDRYDTFTINLYNKNGIYNIVESVNINGNK